MNTQTMNQTTNGNGNGLGQTNMHALSMHHSTITGSIADRAMLVSVNFTSFFPQKLDKKVTRDTNNAHGATMEAGKYQKTLIEKSAVEPIRKFKDKIRNEHERRTLRWAEDGSRILTNTAYDPYARFMRDAIPEWDALVDAFVSLWDDHVDNARRFQGTMHNPADYPNKNEVRRRFSFRWRIRPVPVGDDFRVNMSALETQAIREQLRAEVRDVETMAVQDAYGRVRDVVGHMVTKLRAYDPEKPRDDYFKDSLVTNVRDLIEVLPGLNLTGDANITKWERDMRGLIMFDAQTLRDQSTTRDDVANRAQSILDQMAQFVA